MTDATFVPMKDEEITETTFPRAILRKATDHSDAEMENILYIDIMGPHGLGERNKNDVKLANLHSFRNIAIGNIIPPFENHKTCFIRLHRDEADQSHLYQ